MTRNLKTFIVLAGLITAGFISAQNLVDHLPSALQAVSSLVLLITFFWVYFDLVVKIIYRLVGVSTEKAKSRAKNEPIRLTHQQAAAVNRYWIAWLATSLIVTVANTLLFERSHLITAFLLDGAFLVVISLAVINSKQKIMGHTKKELFK